MSAFVVSRDDKIEDFVLIRSAEAAARQNLSHGGQADDRSRPVPAAQNQIVGIDITLWDIGRRQQRSDEVSSGSSFGGVVILNIPGRAVVAVVVCEQRRGATGGWVIGEERGLGPLSGAGRRGILGRGTEQGHHESPPCGWVLRGAEGCASETAEAAIAGDKNDDDGVDQVELGLWLVIIRAEAPAPTRDGSAPVLRVRRQCSARKVLCVQEIKIMRDRWY